MTMTMTMTRRMMMMLRSPTSKKLAQRDHTSRDQLKAIPHPPRPG